MTVALSQTLIYLHKRDMSRMRNVRMESEKHEFRVNYEGGFGDYVEVKAREHGKRNFKHFVGLTVKDCKTLGEAIEKIKKTIGEKVA